jgi:hypothetical protein
MQKWRWSGKESQQFSAELADGKAAFRNVSWTLVFNVSKLKLSKFRLQKKMESMQERLALVKEIKEVQSKIPWVEYNEKVDRAEEVGLKIITFAAILTVTKILD